MFRHICFLTVSELCTVRFSRCLTAADLFFFIHPPPCVLVRYGARTVRLILRLAAAEHWTVRLILRLAAADLFFLVNSPHSVL